jgi:DNA-binding protein YbaB
MEDLIKALQILLKYGNPEWPTNCSHDVLYVDINPDKVSKEDIETLDKLGFFIDEESGEGFMSFKFGSC